jgi:hypothetical protein
MLWTSIAVWTRSRALRHGTMNVGIARFHICGLGEPEKLVSEAVQTEIQTLQFIQQKRQTA